MQETPRGNRLHIAIFGRRNAGKSSLINALTDQDVALVSEVPGTTTDPVFKAMELSLLGPCLLIDTAGIDDAGLLGEQRIRKTRQVFTRTDLAILLVDPAIGITNFERELKAESEARQIPLVGVVNKIDQGGADIAAMEKELGIPLLGVSALTGAGIEQLKERIIELAPVGFEEPMIAGDLVAEGEICLLVTPIDQAAPKGRLILPQVQTIRDLLDHGAGAIVVQEKQLPAVLAGLRQAPRLVVTDSQVFPEVAAMLPGDVRLTSFSILFARYKGDLPELVRGTRAIEKLRPGDRVLIAEACTHHRQEDDIGRRKIPRLLCRYAGCDLVFHWSSGLGYPEDLAEFQLVVHCGACMINRRQMLYRIQQARARGVPIINYGVLLAFVHGILDRALQPFPRAREVLRRTTGDCTIKQV